MINLEEQMRKYTQSWCFEHHDQKHTCTINKRERILVSDYSEV